MSAAGRIANGLRELAELAGATASRTDELEPIVRAMRRCLKEGGTLFFAGNGGSAADAQHLVAEYVVRYHSGQNRGIRAIALTTDTSVLTAASNDFGFEMVFARQLEVLARPGDVLVVHSCSGNSANIVKAVERARELEVVTVAMLGGDGGNVAPLVDHPFTIGGVPVNQAQELHLAIQHQIAAILTKEFGG